MLLCFFKVLLNFKLFWLVKNKKKSWYGGSISEDRANNLVLHKWASIALGLSAYHTTTLLVKKWPSFHTPKEKRNVLLPVGAAREERKTIMLAHGHPSMRVLIVRLIPRHAQRSGPTDLLCSICSTTWFYLNIKKTQQHIFSVLLHACDCHGCIHRAARPPLAFSNVVTFSSRHLPVRTPRAHSASLLLRAHPRPLTSARRACRSPAGPSLVLLAMVVVVVLTRRRLRPRRLESLGPGLRMLQAHVSSVLNVW
jgi:hypothetical protein